jgi:Tol biopolymer transport system component
VASAATIDVALAAFATDPDGDALTASVVGAPFGAGASANGNTLRLTPPTAAFRGVVRLQYRVTDLSNAQSAPATLLAFVGTQPFQVAYLGNDFATARTDLVLTDLVSDTRQVNPTLAAGAITRFEVSDNAQSFSYVVGQGDAFVVRATTLGTATALFPAALDPQSVHVRTALSPDGARACATYFDGSNPSASALRWRSFVTTVATGARAEVTPDNRVCFGFVNGGADILFLGTNNVVPGDDPAIYRAPAASPTGIAGSPSRLTTLTYEANAGWSLDSVFVASDGSRMLYVQKRAGLESVYHLPLGAGGTDAAISTAFTRIFDLAASPSRDRVAFLAAGQNTDLWGADIAAAGTSTLLFAVPAGRSLAAPVFSPDGTRVAFAANSATAQPDIYDAEFANPMGVTQALGGVEADAPTLRYDASGANLIVSSASTGSASQFRISQAVRGGPPTQSPTVLHPVSQFLGASRSFALTTDSAVVVAALRDAGSGDVRVYLVNRAVPGEALLLSRTTATQASGVRVVAR